jgi:Flp pilus assembly protein TadD
MFACQGRFAESEACARRALSLSHNDLDALDDLGVALWRQGLLSEAEAAYRSACRIKPDAFRLWTNLGLVLAEQGDNHEAAACFRKALEGQPDLFPALLDLGIALADQGHFEHANDALQAALQLRPGSARALWNVGLSLLREGKWDEAIDRFEQGLRREPEFPELHRDLGYALLGRGDYARGWREHEWRTQCREHSGFIVERPRWSGEDLQRRLILLHYEQGIGDTVQFARYAELVKQRGGSVLMLCPTLLLGLLARCPGVDLAFDGTSYQPDCHFQVPLLSLPVILGPALDTLPARGPYVVADPMSVGRWRAILADAARSSCNDNSGTDSPVRPFLIGIAWQGKPTHRLDRWRSFPLAQLAPLSELPGVRLISLQAEHGLDQLRALAGRLKIVELSIRRPRDFLDTAALVSQLDLVITPDSALAHLSGALGARTWVALGAMAEWRWMSRREDSPWYPTMRLFRQGRFGDWDGVFRRMADALGTELAARTPSPREVA